MKRRVALFVVSLLPVSAAAMLACSSKDPAGFADEDSGAPTIDATTDSRAPDTGVSPADTSITDAGHVGDTAPPEAAPSDAGHCSKINGPACDIVLQNCKPTDTGNPQECVAVPTANGFTTGCQPTTASEHLSKGHACCPANSAKGINECLPGLECVGDQSAPCDAGTLLPGRCSPHCCAGDDDSCGAADPEGYAGHCTLSMAINGVQDLFNVCSYDAVCKPWGLKECPPTTVCLIKDTSGTAGCVVSYNPDGGAPPGEGAKCAAANGCAEGLVCLGQKDGGSACTMTCFTPSSITPFDAGMLDGGPFHGGCSGSKKCVGTVVDQNQNPVFPPWVSICQ